jgi:hypothetical protein
MKKYFLIAAAISGCMNIALAADTSNDEGIARAMQEEEEYSAPAAAAQMDAEGIYCRLACIDLSDLYRLIGQIRPGTDVHIFETPMRQYEEKIITIINNFIPPERAMTEQEILTDMSRRAISDDQMRIYIDSMNKLRSHHGQLDLFRQVYSLHVMTGKDLEHLLTTFRDNSTQDGGCEAGYKIRTLISFLVGFNPGF